MTLATASVRGEVIVNNRYFGCRTCKTYTDAGYRWARYQLEDPGIVQAD